MSNELPHPIKPEADPMTSPMLTISKESMATLSILPMLDQSESAYAGLSQWSPERLQSLVAALETNPTETLINQEHEEVIKEAIVVAEEGIIATDKVLAKYMGIIANCEKKIKDRQLQATILHNVQIIINSFQTSLETSQNKHARFEQLKSDLLNAIHELKQLLIALQQAKQSPDN